MQCEHLHTFLYNPYFIGVCVGVCVGQCEHSIIGADPGCGQGAQLLRLKVAESHEQSEQPVAGVQGPVKLLGF